LPFSTQHDSKNAYLKKHITSADTQDVITAQDRCLV
jgi:hypothetical protein